MGVPYITEDDFALEDALPKMSRWISRLERTPTDRALLHKTINIVKDTVLTAQNYWQGLSPEHRLVARNVLRKRYADDAIELADVFETFQTLRSALQARSLLGMSKPQIRTMIMELSSTEVTGYALSISADFRLAYN